MSVETTPLASRARHWTGHLVQVAAIVGLVFLGKGALAEPFYVPSASMEPTLLIGDALLASKFPYGYSAASMPIHIDVPETGRIFGATPKRGDVVVFRWPGDRAQVWVKRVIGLPGDRIQVREGQVWINGTPARVKADGIGEAEDDNGGSEPAHRYIETLPGGVAHPIFKLYDSGRLDNTPEVTVPPDRLFVMGDNRDNSADSRVPVGQGGVGLLPIDDLVGRVDAIVGSWDLGMRSRPITSWLTGFRVSRFFTSVH
jgi:signal peptidase I